MKKQFIILFLLFICYTSWGQNKIPNSGQCTEDELMKIAGRWIKASDYISNGVPKLNKVQLQEVYNRIDAMHKLLQDIYPLPMGADAAWHRSLGGMVFGPKFIYDANKDFSHYKIIGGVEGCTYDYICGIFSAFCSGSPQKAEFFPGYPGETGTWFNIYANTFSNWASSKLDTMTINGLPVYMREPAKESWKGYELLYGKASGEGNAYHILIHRKGVLPYIPVTRKQYLDYGMNFVNTLYDTSAISNMPVRSLEEQEAEKQKVVEKYKKNFGQDPKRLKSTIDNYLAGYQTDQDRRDDMLKLQLKQKKEVLKRYQEELENTTNQGLLDAPAIVWIPTMGTGNPIFRPESEDGQMLITENPAYFRKDLPKYIPQFFVILLSWDNRKSGINFKNLVLENFPIEKLQAMIDK